MFIFRGPRKSVDLWGKGATNCASEAFDSVKIK
jgi:hypothetical protein